MASWVTDEKGLWHPAREIVNLVNYSGKSIVIEIAGDDGKKIKKTIKPGEPYVYDGPDRQALFELWTIDKTGNTKTIGQNFRINPEFLGAYAKAREAFGFQTVDEYLAYIGYDEAKVKEAFDKKASVIVEHEIPRRIEELQTLGGGRDTAGNQNKFGGFGTPKELSAAK